MFQFLSGGEQEMQGCIRIYFGFIFLATGWMNLSLIFTLILESACICVFTQMLMTTVKMKQNSTVASYKTKKKLD